MKGFQSGHGFIYSLCAGLIIGLLFFEMIPESIELGGWVILLGGIAIGLVLFQSIHLLIDKITIITNSHQKDIFVRSGVLLTTSIAIHNFPVGIALGSTIGTSMGNFMLTTLFLHNIPEGIIIFSCVRYAYLDTVRNNFSNPYHDRVIIQSIVRDWKIIFHCIIFLSVCFPCFVGRALYYSNICLNKEK